MGFRYKRWMDCSHKPPWRRQRETLKESQKELSYGRSNETISLERETNSSNPLWVTDLLKKTKTHCATGTVQEEKRICRKRLSDDHLVMRIDEPAENRIAPPIATSTSNKRMHKSVGSCHWDNHRLEEIVTSLEDGSLLTHPSLEDFVCIICRCTKEKNLGIALRLHAYLQSAGLDAHKSLGNYIVSMLVDVGSMSHAQKVFDKLESKSECSWNALINGYIRCGKSKRAFILYKKMMEESRRASGYTFVAMLRICAQSKDMETGRKLHADISNDGLLKSNLFVGNALIDMYAKCGLLEEAQEVFDILPSRTVVTWTTLIAGYAQNGLGNKALKCLEQMRRDNVTPNALTYACSLKACGSIQASEKGKQLHDEVERQGLLGNNQYVGNALVDMYAKCGMLKKAKSVFDKLVARNEVSFNALIAGYVEHEQGEEALACYERMKEEGHSPSAITYTCILKACGSIGAVNKVQEIHKDIKSRGLLRKDVLLGSTLVDIYAKCGALSKAQEVFDQLLVRDALTWTALITGYAQRGETDNVLYYFERMRESGTKPDSITFLSVLNVCSHAGLVDKGQTYYEAMCEDGLIPTVKHHACIVDLLGRAGQLERVVAMMEKTPFQPTMVMWLMVLTACRKWGNVELGRQTFDQAVKLDRTEPALYVCMENIYADAGMHEDAMEVEAMRVAKAGLQ